jgi:hypothetical protein
MVDEFKISFDLSELESQIETAKKSYSSLESSISDVNKSFIEDFKEIKDVVASVQGSIDILNISLTSFYDNLANSLSNIPGLFDNISKSSGDMVKSLKDMDLKSLRGVFKDLKQEDVESRISDVVDPSDINMGSSEGSNLDKRVGDLEDKFSKVISDAKKLEENQKSFFKKLTNNIKEGEKAGLKSGVGGLMGASKPGVLGGGLLGGMIGLMVLGVKEEQRIKAEAGEMLNVFEATGEAVFSKQTQRVNRWFSNFQEKAQWKYAIPRKETQAVVKSLVDAGFTSSEIFEKFGRGLKEVGSNVAILSLGLDKHFNQASGTNIQNITSMVQMYGDSLDSAADKTMRIGIAAQKSGIGIQTFTNAVYGSASALSQYGIDVKSVASTMQQLQKHYEGLGLGKQAAGRQAALGLQGLSEGLAGLSDEFQMAIAVDMYGGDDPISARNKLKSGWLRAASGENETYYFDFAKAIKNFVDRHVTGDRDDKIFFLESKGMSFEGATAAIDLIDKLETGNLLQGDTQKALENLKNSLGMEGRKLTDLQKTQRDLIKNLAKIGQGLIQVVAGLSGTLIMAFKGLGTLFEAWGSSPEKKKEILGEYNRLMELQTNTMVKGFKDIGQGFSGWASELGEFMGGLSSNLSSAVKYDPGNKFEQTINDIKGGMMELEKDMHYKHSVILGTIGEVFADLGMHEKAASFMAVSKAYQTDPNMTSRAISNWWEKDGFEGLPDSIRSEIMSTATQVFTENLKNVKINVQGKHVVQSTQKVNQGHSKQGQ